MSVDLNKVLKSKLEELNLNAVFKDFDKNLQETRANCCCSNDSFIFIYLEEDQTVFVINTNKLSKFKETTLRDSFQVNK